LGSANVVDRWAVDPVQLISLRGRDVVIYKVSNCYGLFALTIANLV